MNIDEKLAELTINPHRIPLSAPGLTFISYEHDDKKRQALAIDKLEEHSSLTYPKIRFDEQPYQKEGYYATPFSVRQTLTELIGQARRTLQDVDEQTYAFSIKNVWTLDGNFEKHLEDALESYAAYRLIHNASKQASAQRTKNTEYHITLTQFYHELAGSTRQAADRMRHALANTLTGENKQRLYAVDESLLDINRSKNI